MEALQQQVAKESKTIRQILVPQTPSQEDEGPVKLSRRQERARQESRQRRFERWQKTHELFGQGYAKKEIARMLNRDIHTVRTYLLASTFAERQRHSPVNGPLEPYKEYLLQRWEQGCHNALQLWREVRERGFPGSATCVRDFLHPLRLPGAAPDQKRAARSVPCARSLAWLLIGKGRGMSEQIEMVERLCPACPVLEQSRKLVLDFRDLLRRRCAPDLEDWLGRAKGSGLSDFATFARGIEQDRAAVEAALSPSWSNGPTEGHVNRLKLIKRQGYGRASFELLKRRVLPLASLAA